MALAKEVTFTTTLNAYGGDGANLAYYVTDANGGRALAQEVGLSVLYLERAAGGLTSATVGPIFEGQGAAR